MNSDDSETRELEIQANLLQMEWIVCLDMSVCARAYVCVCVCVRKRVREKIENKKHDHSYNLTHTLCVAYEQFH